MNFLGIGPLELLILAVIALLVLGPKGLTDLGRKTGQLVRKITRSPLWQEIVNTSRDINDLPGKLMRETELDDQIKEIRDASVLTDQPDRESVKPDQKPAPK
jgi:Sec-independent protein translocase protein TatA